MSDSLGFLKRLKNEASTSRYIQLNINGNSLTSPARLQTEILNNQLDSTSQNLGSFSGSANSSISNQLLSFSEILKEVEKYLTNPNFTDILNKIMTLYTNYKFSNDHNLLVKANSLLSQLKTKENLLNKLSSNSILSNNIHPPAPSTEPPSQISESKTDFSQSQYSKIQVSKENHSGFVEIYDETPDNFTYLRMHPTGTYEKIENNGVKTQKVVNDYKEFIWGNAKVYIKKNRIIVIDKDDRIEIRQNRFTKIHQNDNKEIDKDNNIKIHGNQNINIDKNRNKTINQNENVKISGNKTDNISGNYQITVSGNITVKSSSFIKMNAPMIYLNC